MNERAFRALAAIVRDYARLRGEDSVGAFMLTGGFHVLSDKEIVELARRVDAADPISPNEKKT